MSDAPQCPKCGALIPANAPWGVCPKCLLDPAAHTAEATTEAGTAGRAGQARHFGNYELGRQLGRGGMGVVYEAIHLRLQKRVALKMILDSSAASPVARRRFAIEAEAAAKLDHPCIVPIYDVGEHEDQPFLSMKLVEGESLRHKISKGELGVPGKEGDGSKSASRERQLTLARLMVKVARAVHHAHERHVLHRDLKPGNILIDEKGEPHLTDFGLAKILDATDVEGGPPHLTRSSALVGTPSYMSPEQASNQRVSEASDVYSLGAILYELLTGQPPFKANTLLETIRMVTEQEPKRPRVVLPAVDADLSTICIKCLEKSPAARYSSALALAEDLERWLRQEPIRARPSGPVLRVQRWVKRNPVGTAFIASLCACLAVTLVLLQMALKQRKDDEVRVQVATYELSKQIEESWNNAEQDSVMIHSSMLAALAGLAQRVHETNALPLTFVVAIGYAPVGQATRLAPFLRELELRIGRRLNRQVLLDLRLDKYRSWAVSNPTKDQMDLRVMSRLTCVRLQRAGERVEPLVRHIYDKQGVIFARASLGITTLAQVAGRRVAFAHTNSIISLWAKVTLARAGLRASDFSEYKINETSALRPEPGFKSGPNDISEERSEYYAHRDVLRQVAAGVVDIGVAPLVWFEREKDRGQGLVKLHVFEVPTDVTVVRSDLDRPVIEALEASFLSFTNNAGGRFGFWGQGDGELLDQFSHKLSGFAAVEDADLDPIRRALTNEVAWFEGQRALLADDPVSQRPAR